MIVTKRKERSALAMAVLLTVLILGGCTSIKYSYDTTKPSSGLKTYTWAPAAGIYGATVKDPVCGMDLEEDKAKAAGRKAVYGGKTYYFCSDLCKGKFDKNPELYGGQGSGTRDQSGTRAPRADGQARMAKDLACGMDVDITAPNVIKAEFQGKPYYFCSQKCRDDFMKDPTKYTKQAEIP